MKTGIKIFIALKTGYAKKLFIINRIKSFSTYHILTLNDIIYYSRNSPIS